MSNHAVVVNAGGNIAGLFCSLCGEAIKNGQGVFVDYTETFTRANITNIVHNNPDDCEGKK